MAMAHVLMVVVRAAVTATVETVAVVEAATTAATAAVADINEYKEFWRISESANPSIGDYKSPLQRERIANPLEPKKELIQRTKQT